MLELFTTNNGNNDGKYANPEFDAAIDASKVADKSVHFQKLHEAEDILMKDAAAIPRCLLHRLLAAEPLSEGHLAQPLRLLVPAVRVY